MKQNMSENNDWQFIKTMDEEYKKILRQIGELNRKIGNLQLTFLVIINMLVLQNVLT